MVVVVAGAGEVWGRLRKQGRPREQVQSISRASSQPKLAGAAPSSSSRATAAGTGAALPTAPQPVPNKHRSLFPSQQASQAHLWWWWWWWCGWWCRPAGCAAGSAGSAPAPAAPVCPLCPLLPSAPAPPLPPAVAASPCTAAAAAPCASGATLCPLTLLSRPGPEPPPEPLPSAAAAAAVAAAPGIAPAPAPAPGWRRRSSTRRPGGYMGTSRAANRALLSQYLLAGGREGAGRGSV